jgi:hypothetical protein
VIVHDAALESVVGFVEGRVTAAEFERSLQSDPAVEALLLGDPDLPVDSYVGSSVFLFPLQLDLADPGDVVSAQGALGQWLDRHQVAYSASPEPGEFYNVLLDAQPAWLRVDAKWLRDEVIAKSERRAGHALRQWLHDELLARFRYVSKPPKWIQSPDWPIGPNGPLVFLGQLRVQHYFHDEAAAYVFHDPVAGECRTLIQVA